MSVKKPEPMFPAPNRRLCAVCGKSSYSLSGMHPQCSVVRENTALKAASKAASALAAGLPGALIANKRSFTETFAIGETRMRSSPDQGVTQHVTNTLAGRGINAPCRVSVLTSNGTVTLSGTVQYPHQIGTAVKAASGIAGVRRVIDLLTVKVLAKR